MTLFCCASFFSGFQQLCRGVDVSVTDSCSEKGVHCVDALQSSGCPTLSLSRGHMPVATPQGMDGTVLGFHLVPFLEGRPQDVWAQTDMSSSATTAAMSQLWLPLASARGSEGSQRPVRWLWPWQPQHKSHLRELHINFSELKTCFYFHVTSLKVFFFCESQREELMGIPPEFVTGGSTLLTLDL